MLPSAGSTDPFADLTFSGENGAEVLGTPLRDASRTHDAGGTVTFRDAKQSSATFASSITLQTLPRRVPELEPPFVVRRRPTIFVARRSS